VIGEEYGFIGTMTVIILYSFIAVRGFATSKRINDDYGKYVAIGLTTLITLYAIVNMCVATGLIPTTGVPMPFISYGGTALLINSVAVGILLNISSGRNLKSQNLELNGFQS
jgi:Bacterial cell division membrane protein